MPPRVELTGEGGSGALAVTCPLVEHRQHGVRRFAIALGRPHLQVGEADIDIPNSAEQIGKL